MVVLLEGKGMTAQEIIDEVAEDMKIQRNIERPIEPEILVEAKGKTIMGTYIIKKCKCGCWDEKNKWESKDGYLTMENDGKNFKVMRFNPANKNSELDKSRPMAKQEEKIKIMEFLIKEHIENKFKDWGNIYKIEVRVTKSNRK